MIQHCVFFTFQAAVDEVERTDILTSLAHLVDEIPGLLSLNFGPNADFEQKSKDYKHGFVAVFADRDALTRYASHPKHLALGERLVASSIHGGDGITVFDIVSN